MTHGVADGTALGAPTATTPAELLERLAGLHPEEHRVVSCYLRLEPQDRTRQAYLATVKSRIHTIRDSLDALAPTHELRAAVEGDLERVVEHLRDPSRLPRTRGLAVFACGDLDVFATIPLPRVYRSRLVVDSTALVRELQAVEEEFDRILLAAVDRAHGRIFDITAFRATELPCIPAAATRGGRFHSDRQGAPGWGERDYHQRIRTEKERHYHAVATCLLDLDRARPARGFVVAGPGPVPGAVAAFLHPSLVPRFLGTTKLNPTALSPAQAYEAALAVHAAHGRAAERGKVSALREGFGTGWAVNGLRPTLRALFRGQVRELLVPADAQAAGFRCENTGQLVAVAGDCRGLGRPIPVTDLIDDVIEEALRQRVPIAMLHAPETAAELDGVAATLRFR